MIEVAAYFVVAEALTNVAKHAPEAPVAVISAGSTATCSNRGLVTRVPAGPTRRAAAWPVCVTGSRRVDGTLTVTSPRTEPSGTTIEVELPCGS